MMAAPTSPAYGRSEAEAAVLAFVKIRDRELHQVRDELKTSRDILPVLRRKYESLQTTYLRTPGTELRRLAEPPKLTTAARRRGPRR